jgi:hypothetical protein
MTMKVLCIIPYLSLFPMLSNRSYTVSLLIRPYRQSVKETLLPPTYLSTICRSSDR